MVVLLLALNVANHIIENGLNQLSYSKNSNNKNIQIILAAATTISDARRNIMVGGYSYTLDSNLPEITNVVNFVHNEILAIMSQTTVTTTIKETKETTTTPVTALLYNTIVRQIKEAAANNNNTTTTTTIKVEVLKVQRQVVAGMNYKLTLAIMNTSCNSNDSKEELNNNETINTSCLGGLENMIIYKPLPHTGLSYNIVSWGTVLNTDTVLSMMMDENHSSVEEKLKKKKNEDEDEDEEKAMMIEGEIQQEAESVEPNA